LDWLNRGWNLGQVAETEAIEEKHQITCDKIEGIPKGICPKKGIDNGR
jgi:hypothetical protein